MSKDLNETHGQQGVYNVTYCANEDGRPSTDTNHKSSSLSFVANGVDKEKRKENCQIWKSIVCYSISLNLSYSVLLTLMNSISSLLPENNLGVLSLTSASVTQFVITAFFLTFLNKLFGMKKTLLMATVLLFIYATAFLYPNIGFVIPASLGMGITFATFIGNPFGYVNALGYWYHKVNGGNLDTILSFLSGIANACFGGGFLWGNIIYYLVLKPDYVEESVNITELDICGSSYCNEDNGNSSIAKLPPSWRVNNLIYIFLGMTTLAFLLQLLIADINRSEVKKTDFFSILRSYYLLFFNPRGFLLILITLFVGMEEQFIIVVFTNAYVTCIHGVADIGYVMFNFGAAQFIISLFEALIVKIIGRPAVVVLAFVSFISIFIVLLIVSATQFSLVVFCAITFIYGVANALMVIALCTVYGLLFPDNLEGAFSLFSLWYAIGTLIANSINIYTCVNIQLYILLTVGTAGASSYFVLEYMIYKNILTKKNEYDY